MADISSQFLKSNLSPMASVPTGDPNAPSGALPVVPKTTTPTKVAVAPTPSSTYLPRSTAQTSPIPNTSVAPPTPAPTTAPAPSTPATTSGQNTPIYQYAGGNAAGEKTIVGYRTPTGDILDLQGNKADANITSPYYSRINPANSPMGGAEQFLSAFQKPRTEEDLFNRYREESQALIDAINKSYDVERDRTLREQADARANAGGQAGYAGLSPADISGFTKRAGDAFNPVLDKIQSARNTDIQTIFSKIRDSSRAQAQKDLENARTSATDSLSFQKEKLTQATQHVQDLAKAHVDWDKFKTDSPQEYQQLLNLAGGDANRLDAIFANSIPKPDVIQQYINGSKLIQVTQDPVTRKVSTQSYDLGMDLPKNYKMDKIGSNSAIFYDPATFNPADPKTFKIFALDPLTGLPVQTDINGGDEDGGEGLGNILGGGEGEKIVTATTTLMGVQPTDMTIPVAQAVDKYGIENLVTGLIVQEGGSPKGVENNPGNIKFVGLPDQTDSGVKATDGGTFASYKTKEDGIRAVANLVQKNANKPLNEFIASYKGVKLATAGQPDAGTTKTTTTQTIEAPFDKANGSITSVTGLSVPVFNFLTRGTESMSRMSSAQRNQIMNTAEKWLNDNGVDLSTFQSRYKAYNEVLNANIQRQQKTAIMEHEIIGTIENLRELAQEGKLSNTNLANVGQILLGNQVNDPIAVQYAFHFQQLVNEMAGYFAASQGKNSPDVIDNEDAAKSIAKGLSDRGLAGIQEAVENSTVKMKKIMQDSVDRANHDVWNLFGVGDQYPSDKNLVEKAFNKAGIKYTEAVAKVPKGEILVVDRKTGQVGSIPVGEFDAKVYIRA